MTCVVMQVKWSVTFTDRLGPETVLERKGQVLHGVRLHVKIPGIYQLDKKLQLMNLTKSLKI